MRILAIGTLPPPLGGQAVMFARAIDVLRTLGHVDVVDIQVQRNIGEAGALSAAKIKFFMQLLLQDIRPILRRPHYDVLYYSPAGPNRIGLIKDIVLLWFVRKRARKVVFHFHATGSGAYIRSRKGLLRVLGQRVLFNPDLAIRCADVQPNDAETYAAAESVIVPNGIEDPLGPYRKPRARASQASLTFIGAMVEDKGIFELIEVAVLLQKRGLDFVINFVGEGTDQEIARFDQVAHERGVAQHMRRLGVVAGNAKFDLLFATDVFVFASFFRAETQSLAVIEAHAMGVPAVVYDWRGAKTIVEDGATGYVVKVRDVQGFADRVAEILSANNDGMRAAARARFEARFTAERFAADLKAALSLVGAAP